MKLIFANTLGLLTLLSVTGWAQESGETSRLRTAYESALLDSTYRYELLKPTFYSLKSAYESQTKEVTELRTAMRLQAVQIEMQKQNFEATISEEREKNRGKWWRGLRIGFGIGVAGGMLIDRKL